MKNGTQHGNWQPRKRYAQTYENQDNFVQNLDQCRRFCEENNEMMKYIFTIAIWEVLDKQPLEFLGYERYACYDGNRKKYFPENDQINVRNKS